MKIIIPMLGFGKAGGHRVLSMLASQWQQRGHDVIFVCPRNYHDLYYPTDARIIYLATVYQYLPSFLQNRATRDIFGLVSLLIALWRRAGKGDVILANRDLTAYVVWLAVKLTSATGFYYIQAYEPDFYTSNKKSFLPRLARYISAKTYSLPLIRIVNAEIYRCYREISSDLVIAPGYDDATFYPRDFREFSADSVTIGCIGRKQEWKGTAELIAGVANAANSDARIRLVVAFELPENFTLPGFAALVDPHGDENLANFYRSCDIFITAGKIQHGAFHYPSLEALACGVPLISSPYYPADENNSIVLKDVSPPSISAAILTMLALSRNELEQMRSNGLAAASQCGWKKCSDRFLEVFSAASS